jgi:hypothetical protein
MRSTGEQYLRKYPRLRKWINQCVTCQTQGYKPETPDDSSRLSFKNIKRLFLCLPLNSDGLCETCTKMYTMRIKFIGDFGPHKNGDMVYITKAVQLPQTIDLHYPDGSTESVTPGVFEYYPDGVMASWDARAKGAVSRDISELFPYKPTGY